MKFTPFIRRIVAGLVLLGETASVHAEDIIVVFNKFYKTQFNTETHTASLFKYAPSYGTVYPAEECETSVFVLRRFDINFSGSYADASGTYTMTGINARAFERYGGALAAYSGQVTIPATVSYGGYDYVVAAIGEYAFDNCINITGFIISEGLTEIGESAFSRRAAMKRVSIPSTVTKIGSTAFDHSGITSIVIPSSVESIGAGALYNCESLTTVDIQAPIETLETMMFKGDFRPRSPIFVNAGVAYLVQPSAIAY